MFRKFEKFDSHLKLADGIHQQTVLGAIITFISILIVIYLIITETSLYLKKDIVNHLVKDDSQGYESIKLLYQIEFYNIQCDKLTFSQELIRGSVHYTDLKDIIKEPIRSNELINTGCKVTGDEILDKVGGVLKFATSIDILSLETIELSHKINYFAFIPADEFVASEELIPGVHNPLNDQITKVDENTGIYQYSIQVIPTEYTKKLPLLLLSHSVKYVANQYSVTERQVSIQQAASGVVLSNQNYQNFFGILFTYDFSPVSLSISDFFKSYLYYAKVKLVLKDESESFIDFITSLCGIIGGIITILMLFEKLLHQSVKAIIGKED